MTFVYADLTPFWDRWGSRHTRLIYQGPWILAAVKAWVWCLVHQHGSAFLSDRELTEADLNS